MVLQGLDLGFRFRRVGAQILRAGARILCALICLPSSRVPGARTRVRVRESALQIIRQVRESAVSSARIGVSIVQAGFVASPGRHSASCLQQSRMA